MPETTEGEFTTKRKHSDPSTHQEPVDKTCKKIVPAHLEESFEILHKLLPINFDSLNKYLLDIIEMTSGNPDIKSTESPWRKRETFWIISLKTLNALGINGRLGRPISNLLDLTVCYTR